MHVDLMHEFEQFIACFKGLVVYFAQFCNDLQGDKVDDAVRYRMLVCKQHQVGRLGDKGNKRLKESKCEGDQIASLHKQIGIVVHKLHE